MKISNNALNFLLAQYRAIFKRAYVKGIASAVLLTAGLAAGQAQAGILNDATKLPASGDITITGTASDDGPDKYQYIQISSGSTESFNGTLTIESGIATGAGNYIKGNGDADPTNISGSGTININITEDSNASTHGLAIIGQTQDITVDVGTVNVDQGQLKVAFGTSDQANSKLIANEIIVGTQNATNRNAFLTIKAIADSALTSEVGDADTEITVNKGGMINMQSSGTATAILKGSSLVLNEGALLLADSGASNTIDVDDFELKSGAFHVVSGTGVKQTFTGYTGDVYGNVSIGGGSTLILSNTDRPAEPENDVEAIDANVTVHEGANVQLTGTLSISGGTLTVNEGAKLYATTDAGTGTSGSIVVSKKDTTNGTLAIDSTTLSQFLKGTDAEGTALEYKAIEQGSTANSYKMETVATASGGSVILSDGILEITGTSASKSFDLAGLSFVQKADATAGVKNTIVLNSGSGVTQNTIVSDFLTVSDKLQSGGTAITSASKLVIEAKDTLTLGDTDDFTSANAFGFNEAKAKNLVLKVKSGSDFVLQDKVTLSATREVTQNGEVIIEGDTGTITGDFIVSGGTAGGLTIENGTYTNTGNITVSGGKLSVVNTDLSDDGSHKFVDTKWIVSGELQLNAGVENSAIVVNGNNADTHSGGAQTVLDIQNAKFTLKDGATHAASIEVQSGGILVAKADQLKEMIKDTTSTNSGAKVFVDDGTIQIVNDLELSAAKLTSGSDMSSADDSFLTFSQTNGGTLKVDGALTLTDATGVDIGGSSEIIAETLTINNQTDDNPVTYGESKLVSGKYLAQSVLNSADKTKNINISGAQVFLGDFNELKGAEGNTYYEAVEGSDSGRIDVNLQLTDADSALTVQNGSWTGQSVTVTAGDLNVGLRDTLGFDGNGVKKDVNDEAIGATLTLATLSVSGGKAAVAEGSTLNVNDFTVTKATDSAAGLTVYGTTTVNGKKTTTGTPAETKYGVDIGAGSIQVADGGLLQFKDDALEALQISNTSGTNGYIDAGASYKAGSITVDAGGEVLFDFDSGTSLSAAQLRELRSDIFVGNGATVSDGASDSFNLVAGAINLGQADIAEIQADKDGNYSWDSLAQYSDIIANYTTNDLKSAIVYGVDAGDPIRGHYGALKSDSLNDGTPITIVGDTSLNNAAAQKGIFALGNQGGILGLNASNAHVELNNGGQIGTVALDGKSTLVINGDQGITAPAETVIKSIDGEDGSEAEFVLGKTTVNENSDIGNLVIRAGSDVTFKGTLTVGSTGDVETVLAGTSNTFEGEATFKNNTYIEGAATFQDGVTFNSNETGIYANTEVTGGATFATNSSRVEIGGNSTFTADSIELTANSVAGTPGIKFVVGEEDYVEDGQTHEGSTGYLQADAFKLAGNTLVVDPSYDRETSIAYVKNFTDGASKEDAGIFSGKLIAGQNAALIVGTSKDVYDDAMAVIKGYQNSRGALIQDEVGALVYIGDQLTAEAGSRIIIDSQRTQDQIFGTRTITGALNDGSYRGDYVVNGTTVQTNQAADLFLGVNTVMVVSDNILDKKDNVAVHFMSDDAHIMAEKAEGKEHAAKIVLDGNGFLDSREVTLFTDTGTGSSTANGVKVLGDQDIRVETLNGVMYFMLNAGEEVTGGTLNLDTTKIDTAFLGATDESRNLLFAYTSQTANWEEYFDEANLAKVDNDPTKVKREQLHGDVASTTIANYDDGVALTQAALDSGEYQPEDFIAVPLLDEDGKQITDKETGKALGTVYHRAYNDLLEAIARNTNGAATDSAALQGVFGGAAQAALLAARTSQEAVAGRTGVGASSSALTFADNSQGAGLWVNPIYVSQDSDGFEVGNKDYGVDIDLYGVALGGDYTLANGVRVGAFFNVGSGEADGNGQANGVSNDFDYYGVGLYAGYSVGQFSIVGDVSYSVVDSEIDASTAVGKITSSFDTDNLSVGVTGQYEFDFNGTLVTPHVGLRYSALSVDDYSFKAADYTQGGDASIDDANVFSIPVGVTVAKEFAFNTWTVKPSLDVTVQGNFGDDELDSTAEWDNVAWQSNYSSEFIDNFTYGATLGVAAKTGSFSAGIGLGYQGSSNTDEFSATANARFVF